jgi:long-chain acyl-CoA synthetase
MTIKEMLEQSVERRGNAVAMRYKDDGTWHDISYRQLMGRVRQVAEILGDLDVKSGDRVALYRENSPEWPEIYLGIVSTGAIAVPIDAKLQEQEVAHILRDSEACLLFASAKNYALIRQIDVLLPSLKAVVLLDGQDVLPVQNGKLRYEDYEGFMQLVEESAEQDNAFYDEHTPEDNDIASLIYTSGTTGRQKGAMLTHANFTSNVQSCQQAIEIEETDNFMLVLPLHHAFAFTGNLLLPLGCGSEISFVESLKTIGENMGEAEPTVLIGVPLLLEKMYRRIESGLRQKKAAYIMTKIGLSKVVGKKILKKLGGKLRLVVTGGAPCDPVLEGYGLTETAPVLTLNPIDAPKAGSVGRPVPDVEIQIKNPNEAGCGEITARGPNIMLGYYNNPEATEEVMDGDWFLTGDIGFIDKDGYVTINGRQKNLIVNREGKNIYPEEVENAINHSRYILEVIALGYSEPGQTTGERVGVIVVPNQEAIDAYAAQHKKKMRDKDIQELIQREVKETCQRIADYKRPRRIQIRFEEFEKTSTQKIKRYLYAIDTTEI